MACQDQKDCARVDGLGYLPSGSASEKQLHNLLLGTIQTSGTIRNIHSKRKMFQAWCFFSIFTAVQTSSSLSVHTLLFKAQERNLTSPRMKCAWTEKSLQLLLKNTKEILVQREVRTSIWIDSELGHSTLRVFFVCLFKNIHHNVMQLYMKAFCMLGHILANSCEENCSHFWRFQPICN